MGALGRALYTAYVLLLLSITVPPAWTVLLLLPGGPLPNRVLKRWAQIVIRASGCRLRATGLEHLQKCGPAVLIANHASYIDSIVLMATIPIEYRFVVDARHAAWPLVGLAIRKAGHIPVDRSTPSGRLACAVAMARTLERGTSVMVFPEGSRGGGRDLLPFRSGAFRAAIATGRPVVPITLSGTRRIWPRDALLVGRGSMDVTVHPPIDPAGRTRDDMRRLRDSARIEMARTI